ncbi:MAG: B12-binding domain-containing radical SAM protein [Candidatus Eisenbacteria bacterium]|nr:B12-binding domain-containing radical SAM protein [Candidatus Eisenbacteria bacterium]
MDILLTHGYFLADDAREREIMRPYAPLGLLHLSAWLKQQGFSVAVADATFASVAEIEARIERERPPVVGIYGNLMTRGNVVRLARAAGAAGARVILGGPEPSSYPEEFLARGADAIVVGEGEQTLEELLGALRTHGPHRLERVAGVIYRDEKGQVRRTPPRGVIKNLDDLPDPDRAAIDQMRYVETWRRHHGAGSISLLTARGCPFTCEWCSHEVYGRTHRRRSVGRVVAEIEQIRERYGPDQLWIADDVFTIGHGWLFEFARRMRERGLTLPFECISRADRMNAEVVEALAALRCRRIWIGSESGSQRILDAMRRGVTVEQVRRAVELARRHGIEVGMFLMWGYEGEERADVEATIAHVGDTSPDAFLTTIAYPIKGTPYHAATDGRRREPPDWEGGSDRQIAIARRFSRRFYSFADRRLSSRLEIGRARARGGATAWTHRWRHELRDRFYRLAMSLHSGRGVT